MVKYIINSPDEHVVLVVVIEIVFIKYIKFIIEKFKGQIITTVLNNIKDNNNTLFQQYYSF